VIVTFDGHSVGHPNRSLNVENQNVGQLAERKLLVERRLDNGLTGFPSEHP